MSGWKLTKEHTPPAGVWLLVCWPVHGPELAILKDHVWRVAEGRSATIPMYWYQPEPAPEEVSRRKVRAAELRAELAQLSQI